MPSAVSKAVSYARSLALQLSVSQGAKGAFRVLGTVVRGRVGSKRAAPVGIPMKKLGGCELLVRPGASDLRNASYYYRDRLYLPPAQAVECDLRQICELGANIGASLAALAYRYPNARVLGVEPDPGNAALARLNVAQFGRRCEVVEAGIWDSSTELVVDRDSRYGEHGFSVRPRRETDPAELEGVRALHIDALLAEHMPEGPIDYMQINIEGTEPRAFAAGGGWPARVRSLRVEAHPELGYPAGQCVEDLRGLGFEAWADEKLPEKWILAVRS